MAFKLGEQGMPALLEKYSFEVDYTNVLKLTKKWQKNMPTILTLT